MSRGMRASARNPANATATTAITSEIGRRNANDTKFMASPQPVAVPGGERTRLDDTDKLVGTSRRSAAQMFVQMLSSGVPLTSGLSRTWTEDRLGMAGSLLAPTTQELIQGDQTASGQTVAGPRTSLLCLVRRRAEQPLLLG